MFKKAFVDEMRCVFPPVSRTVFEAEVFGTGSHEDQMHFLLEILRGVLCREKDYKFMQKLLRDKFGLTKVGKLKMIETQSKAIMTKMDA